MPKRDTSICFLVAMFLLFCASTASCQAELKANAGEDVVVTAGDRASFSGTLSTGDIVRYRWDFGDHEYFDKAATFFERDLKALKPGEGPTPSHTYWKPGRYVVTLTVFDSNGNSDSDTMVVTVEPNTAPQARISASVENKLSGEVLADASPSFDPEGDRISFLWNFSDGSTSSEKAARHKYDLEQVRKNIGECKADYQVVLRAADPHGAVDLGRKWVSFATSPEVAAEKARPFPYTTDLIFASSVRDGKLRAEKSPETIGIFTGERMLIPFKVTNNDAKGYVLGVADVSPKNTFVRLEQSEIRPNQTSMLAMEIQTLNVYDHTLEFTLKLGSSSLKYSVPVTVKIKPFTPLIGGYAHFVRHAAGQLTGRPFRPQGKFTHISLGIKKAAEDMTNLTEYPIQVYRASCQWHNVQREGPDSYDWTLSDWEIDQAVKNGARVIVTFATGPPKWVGRYDFTNDPKALEYYGVFVAKMVDRYGDKVDYYELSNEPFSFWLRKFWGPKKLQAVKKNPEAARREMEKFMAVITKAAQVAHDVISEKDPTAILTMPGFENKTRKPWDQPLYFSIWETLFKKGVQRYCQRVGVHDFPLWYNAEPPQLGDLPRWRKLDENADSSQLLRVMKQYNIPPAIWLTEFGGFRNSDETEVNHAMAMLHTTAIIAHQHGEGMTTVGLYDYPTDDSPYVYLMKYENGHRTLGFYALKHMISALSGATPFESEKIKNSGIIGADYDSVVPKLFNRGSEDIMCIWNNSASRKRVKLSLSSGFDKTKILEVLETSFSASGEFYSQRRYSRFADSGDALYFDLQPLDFKVLQIVTPSPRFYWLAALDY